jgi:pyruvate kinase
MIFTHRIEVDSSRIFLKYKATLYVRGFAGHARVEIHQKNFRNLEKAERWLMDQEVEFLESVKSPQVVMEKVRENGEEVNG